VEVLIVFMPICLKWKCQW